MQIFLKTIQGESLAIEVDAMDSVKCVKQKVAEQYAFEAGRVQLFYRGKKLSDEARSLGDYSIKKRCALLLVLKGGSKSSAEEYDCTGITNAQCKNNCVFFGQSNFMGLCSGCYILQRIAEKGLKLIDHPNPLRPLGWTASTTLNMKTSSPSTSQNNFFDMPKLSPSNNDLTAINFHNLDSTYTDDDDPADIDAQADVHADAKNGEGTRCRECKRKVPITLTSIKCKCGHTFCSMHRYSDKHRCTFGYRDHARAIIERENPRVIAQKIQKL
jgi:hypothetical protein